MKNVKYGTLQETPFSVSLAGELFWSHGTCASVQVRPNLDLRQIKKCGSKTKSGLGLVLRFLGVYICLKSEFVDVD